LRGAAGGDADPGAARSPRGLALGSMTRATLLMADKDVPQLRREKQAGS